MTPTPLDDRSFESSVTLTPEQIEANTLHFAGKGLEYSVRTLDEDGKPTETPKPEDTAVADAKPADNAAPAEGEDADAKAADAELLQAKTDEARLGYNAKRTKRIKELTQEVETNKAALATKDALLAEKDKELDRLLKAGAPAASVSAPSAFAPPAQAAPAAATAAPAKQAPVEEEIKPKEFDRAAPKEPVWDEILASDMTGDPYKAYADAGIKYNREILQWELDKRDHDRTQTTEVARLKQEQVQKQDQQRQTQESEQKKFNDALTRYPDFNEVTSSKPFTPILRYLLKDRIADGLDLGYQLAKPENAALYKELEEKTADDRQRAPGETMRLLDEVMLDLGAFRKELKNSANGKSPAAAAAPAAPKPNAGAPAQQSSSTKSPRIEEAAAPAPVKGKASGTPKSIEDIDPEDSDARRALKKAQGLM